MTIDKAIAKIWHCIVSIRDCIGNKEFVEALELSMEVMRKYQIIQKVLEKVWNTPSCMLDEAECLNEIMETYRTVR